MKNVRVLIVPIPSSVGRKDLERIEGVEFDSMKDVFSELGKGFEYYTLSDFMDLCNDSDSDTTYIDLDKSWVGYITLTEDI